MLLRVDSKTKINAYLAKHFIYTRMRFDYQQKFKRFGMGMQFVSQSCSCIGRKLSNLYGFQEKFIETHCSSSLMNTFKKENLCPLWTKIKNKKIIVP